jgi:hypothetical protein
VVIVCVVCVLFYSYLRHGPSSCLGFPKRSSHLDTFASIGNAFGILSALFSGLAFSGLIVTVWLQKEQIQSTLKGLEASANQQTLSSLQTRVGELISERVLPGTDIRRYPQNTAELKVLSQSLRDGTEEERDFLAAIGGIVTPKIISVSDAFRRKFVFSTLESFFTRVPADQAETLNGLLLAQLHDEAMRSLILQALADQDAELLRTYSKLKMNVAVLNEFPALCHELERRFGFRNVGV